MLLTGTQLLQLALRLRELARRAVRPGGENAFTIDELRCACKSVLGRDVAPEALEVLCDTLLEHDPTLKVASHFTRVHAFFDPLDVGALKQVLDGIDGLLRDAPPYGAVRVAQPARFVEVILNEDRDKEVGVFSGALLFTGTPYYWSLYQLGRALSARLGKLGYKLRDAGRRSAKGLLPVAGLAPFSDACHRWDHPAPGRRTYGFYLEPRS